MNSKRTFPTFFSALFILFACVLAEGAFYNTAEVITSPYWDATLDAAGYGDEFWWGNSPYHPHAYHELLSGEWGAAIYYEGIATDSNAMWVTNYFQVPDWDTMNDFGVQTAFSSWDHANNPVDVYDTGQSVIKNDEVEVGRQEWQVL